MVIRNFILVSAHQRCVFVKYQISCHFAADNDAWYLLQYPLSVLQLYTILFQNCYFVHIKTFTNRFFNCFLFGISLGDLSIWFVSSILSLIYFNCYLNKTDINKIIWTTLCWIYQSFWYLTHWGLVTHICVSKLTITGSDNGLCLLGTKQSSDPVLEYCKFVTYKNLQISKSWSHYNLSS